MKAPLLVAALAAIVASPLVAQASPWDYRGLEMTREDLQELLSQYEAVVSSPVYSERLRGDAEASAAQIRERLENGDFGVGDRIVLHVEAMMQAADTLLIEPGREITLPGMGRISLAGVLRSELQAHLEKEIARFVKEPTIQTFSLIRLSLQGMVGRPGFYVVPATALLEDVIMMAGGPSPAADLDKVEVTRGGQVLLTGDVVRSAFAEGRSVDQLNLRAGDQIIVPTKAGSSIWWTLGRYALIAGSTLLLGVRVF